MLIKVVFSVLFGVWVFYIVSWAKYFWVSDLRQFEQMIEFDVFVVYHVIIFKMFLICNVNEKTLVWFKLDKKIN